VLSVVADDGRVGSFDVSPYLAYEAIEELRDPVEFSKISRKCWNVRPDPVTAVPRDRRDRQVDNNKLLMGSDLASTHFLESLCFHPAL